MFKVLSAIVLSSVLPGPTTVRPMQQQALNNPAFPKGQQGSNSLVYVVPEGWQHDTKSEGKVNYVGVLVPKGRSMTRTDSLITIEYVRKDPNTPGLENLNSYVRDDLKQTLSHAPDVQFAKWQPTKLDPAKLNYWSIEMFAKEGNNPSPQHYLILDSGDGFYSVTLTVGHRGDLQQPLYEEFFNGLGLALKP